MLSSIMKLISLTDFTYEKPNEERFLNAVLLKIREKGSATYVSHMNALLSDSKCTITHTGHFSEGAVWNAYYTKVNFALPIETYEKMVDTIDDTIKDDLKTICNEIMPPNSGLEVMEVNFSIRLDEVPQTTDSLKDLKNITDVLPDKLKIVLIPDDIRQKAEKMAEVYVYTYCVENSLRVFIEDVAKQNYGEKYLTGLKLSRDMQEKIKTRKAQQQKKKWLSARGSSDIFYLDIEDLGNLIQNNWGIFKGYFESIQWITTNIGEIADCRNPVAHHCYLQEHEREIIRLNFVKILKQISETFK